jgi:PQQ-dependent catabolism-associated CXXCW motif protein
MMRRCRLALLLLCPALPWIGPAMGAAGVAEPEGYWEGNVDAPTPAALHGGRVIRVEELVVLLRQGRAVVIDVSNTPRRPAELAPGAPWLPLPHRAIPGALWFPGVGVGTPTREVEDSYRDRLREATAGNVDAPLIVYCHANCWLSWNAAKRAIGYGYRSVFWFPDGIEGWIAAGQQTAGAAPREAVAAAPVAVAPAAVTPAAVTPVAVAPAAATAVAAAPTTPAPAAQAPGAALGPAVPLPALAVLDLELTGDLGGPEFEAEHAERLRIMSARLRQDLESTGLYRILDNSAAQGLIDTLKSRQAYLHDCNGCDLDVGRSLHADQVLVAWVDRVSGLILSLTYEIHQVQTGQIAARKSFDFRGDNNNAWNHAIDYMVRDLAKK